MWRDYPFSHRNTTTETMSVVAGGEYLRSAFGSVLQAKMMGFSLPSSMRCDKAVLKLCVEAPQAINWIFLGSQCINKSVLPRILFIFSNTYFFIVLGILFLPPSSTSYIKNIYNLLLWMRLSCLRITIMIQFAFYH